MRKIIDINPKISSGTMQAILRELQVAFLYKDGLKPQTVVAIEELLALSRLSTPSKLVNILAMMRDCSLEVYDMNRNFVVGLAMALAKDSNDLPEKLAATQLLQHILTPEELLSFWATIDDSFLIEIIVSSGSAFFNFCDEQKVRAYTDSGFKKLARALIEQQGEVKKLSILLAACEIDISLLFQNIAPAKIEGYLRYFKIVQNSLLINETARGLFANTSFFALFPQLITTENIERIPHLFRDELLHFYLSDIKKLVQILDMFSIYTNCQNNVDLLNRNTFVAHVFDRIKQKENMELLTLEEKNKLSEVFAIYFGVADNPIITELKQELSTRSILNVPFINALIAQLISFENGYIYRSRHLRADLNGLLQKLEDSPRLIDGLESLGKIYREGSNPTLFEKPIPNIRVNPIVLRDPESGRIGPEKGREGIYIATIIATNFRVFIDDQVILGKALTFYGQLENELLGKVEQDCLTQLHYELILMCLSFRDFRNELADSVLAMALVKKSNYPGNISILLLLMKYLLETQQNGVIAKHGIDIADYLIKFLVQHPEIDDDQYLAAHWLILALNGPNLCFEDFTQSIIKRQSRITSTILRFLGIEEGSTKDVFPNSKGLARIAEELARLKKSFSNLREKFILRHQGGVYITADEEKRIISYENLLLSLSQLELMMAFSFFKLDEDWSFSDQYNKYYAYYSKLQRAGAFTSIINHIPFSLLQPSVFTNENLENYPEIILEEIRVLFINNPSGFINMLDLLVINFDQTQLVARLANEDDIFITNLKKVCEEYLLNADRLCKLPAKTIAQLFNIANRLYPEDKQRAGLIKSSRTFKTNFLFCVLLYKPEPGLAPGLLKLYKSLNMLTPAEKAFVRAYFGEGAPAKLVALRDSLVAPEEAARLLAEEKARALAAVEARVLKEELARAKLEAETLALQEEKARIEEEAKAQALAEEQALAEATAMALELEKQARAKADADAKTKVDAEQSKAEAESQLPHSPMSLKRQRRIQTPDSTRFKLLSDEAAPLHQIQVLFSKAVPRERTHQLTLAERLIKLQNSFQNKHLVQVAQKIPPILSTSGLEISVGSTVAINKDGGFLVQFEVSFQNPYGQTKEYTISGRVDEKGVLHIKPPKGLETLNRGFVLELNLLALQRWSQVLTEQASREKNHQFKVGSRAITLSVPTEKALFEIATEFLDVSPIGEKYILRLAEGTENITDYDAKLDVLAKTIFYQRMAISSDSKDGNVLIPLTIEMVEAKIKARDYADIWRFVQVPEHMRIKSSSKVEKKIVAKIADPDQGDSQLVTSPTPGKGWSKGIPSGSDIDQLGLELVFEPRPDDNLEQEEEFTIVSAHIKLMSMRTAINMALG